jgi:hypothetical protein
VGSWRDPACGREPIGGGVIGNGRIQLHAETASPEEDDDDDDDVYHWNWKEAGEMYGGA